MKHFLQGLSCFMLGMMVSAKVSSQLVIAAGGQWVQSSGYSVLYNTSLVTNNTLTQTGGTFRFSGTTNNTISGSALPTFFNLEVDKGAGNQLALQRGIEVNNNINFITGLIDLNNNNIILNGLAALTNESENSRITGQTGGYVQATALLNAPSLANPGNLGAIISSAASFGNTVIRRGHTSQVNSSGGGNSVYRYYDLLPANTAATPFTLRINYFDAELNGLNEPALVMVKSDNLTNWMLQNYTQRDAAANFVSYQDIPDYRLRWTLSEVNVLPVQLLTFQASCSSEGIKLKWATTREVNTQHFDVQRSSNGTDWQTIARVPAANNASTELHYSSLDKNVQGGMHYRLMIVDLSGSTTYSGIRTVNCDGNTPDVILYPNPADARIQLLFQNVPDASVQLTIHNNTGQLLGKQSIVITGTQQTYTMPVAGLPAGLYHVMLQSAGMRRHITFVKK